MNREPFVVESLEFLPVVVTATSRYAAKRDVLLRADLQRKDITITVTRTPRWGERLGRDYHQFLLEQEEKETV